MPKATRAFHNRLAVFFDFDDTLAPSSFDTLLESVGLDPEAFRKEQVQPLSEAGWDDTLARFYRLIEHSNRRGEPITKEHIEQIGRDLEPFEGVPEMFDRVRETARAVVEDIEVEFYLLTCGFVDLHRATSFADEFEAMWGSEFHFDDEDRIAFAKQTITFPEKTRYVLQLAKGLGEGGPNAPADVYRDVPPEEWHVPLDQIIYVGDGGSDMPTFELLHDNGGMALGVFKKSPEQWGGHSDMRRSRHVQNLARAEYHEGSELMRSLLLSVESICKTVALRRLSRGE